MHTTHGGQDGFWLQAYHKSLPINPDARCNSQRDTRMSAYRPLSLFSLSCLFVLPLLRPDDSFDASSLFTAGL